MRLGSALIRNATVVICLAALTACVTPTPYGPAPSLNGNGYTTQRIESNRFRVSFRGNSVTPRQTVDTYMLYRCAELTVENGYDYFIIVNKDVDKNTGYEDYGDDLAWGWGGGWGWRRPGWGDWGWDYSRPVNSYDAIADIVLYRGQKPGNNPYAYNAREVMAAIGPTLVGPGGAPVGAAVPPSNAPPPPPSARS